MTTGRKRNNSTKSTRKRNTRKKTQVTTVQATRLRQGVLTPESPQVSNQQASEQFAEYKTYTNNTCNYRNKRKYRSKRR